MKLPIEPETKVGALLEAYPGVEDALIAWVPAFAKLKNPILRKTVAKVATLEQAARVGGVSVRELVCRLREATGQATAQPPVSEAARTETSAPEAPPAWLDQERVRARIDADRLLETGEHPMGKVRQSLARIQPGEIVELSSSFRPEPLIEAMRHAGLRVHSAEPSPGRHLTYISHP